MNEMCIIVLCKFFGSSIFVQVSAPLAHILPVLYKFKKSIRLLSLKVCYFSLNFPDPVVKLIHKTPEVMLLQVSKHEI